MWLTDIIECGDILLRPATPEDTAYINEYYRDSYYKYAFGGIPEIESDELRTMAADDSKQRLNFILLAYNADGQGIGFTAGFCDVCSNKLWLRIIVIKKCYAGLRYGTRICEMLFRYFKMNFDIAECLVSVDGRNMSGVKFWTFNNFVTNTVLHKSAKNESIPRTIHIMVRKM